MRTVVILAAVAMTAADARAEDCTGETGGGGRFATCFDNGNRVSLTAGTDGLGGSIALRHVITFDDEPDLAWKLEHELLQMTHATLEDRFTGVVYRGHFLRHARDGHIVIPLGTPKKVFLPFDIGALAEVGRLSWEPDTSIARIGVVKMAALFDLSRTRSFRRRLAFGPSARWDIDVDRDQRELSGQTVSPFSSMTLDLRAESVDGLWVGSLVAEGGTVWKNRGVGWVREVAGEATVERIMLAINDRPLAVFAGVRYDSEHDEVIARVGARVVLAQRRDPRVRLGAPRVSAR